jgi:hypothetical protein
MVIQPSVQLVDYQVRGTMKRAISAMSPGGTAPFFLDKFEYFVFSFVDIHCAKNVGKLKSGTARRLFPMVYEY